MARVFKRKYRKTLANGETELKVSQKWHVEYRDADGIRRSKPAFRDKTASQQFAAQLEKEAELQRWESWTGMPHTEKDH